MAFTMSHPHEALADPDVQLMLRAKQGDRSAFTQLVGTYRDPLVRRLTCLLQHQVDAEDVAQEVFVRAYVARAGYEPRGTFSAWLFRIAHNTACNFRRDRARRREVVQIVDGPLDRSCGGSLSTRTGQPTDETVPSEAGALLQSALRQLNVRQRRAFLLQHVHGMSYLEIGKEMGTNVGTVRSLLARARDNLRRVLHRARST